MTTTLQRLASWARGLEPDHLPARVAERVRLQHLGIAGAVRAVETWPLARALTGGSGTRGAAPLLGGGRSSRRDAVRVHTSLAALAEFDDWLFSAHVGAAAVPAAWAYAGGHDVDQVVCATAAADELAGRLGAALFLGPGRERAELVVSSVAAATAAGLLAGLDEVQLAHALALACVGPGRAPWSMVLSGDAALGLAHGAAAVAGVDAVELARRGLTGPLGALDDRGGLLDQLTPAPLRAAFTGLGQAWLSQTLAYAVHPASIHIQVPVQAVDEILLRHVKAADKRLRGDQVQRIRVELGASGWCLDQLARRHPSAATTGWVHRLPQALGRLVVTHQADPAELAPGRLEAKRDAIAAVAGRVEVRHSWTRTLELVEHIVDVAGPLFAGLSLSELRAAGAAWAVAAPGVTVPAPGAAELVALARLRPGRLLERLRYQSGDLADARLDELQLRLGADVRLFTTRGGSWPERRDIPVGSPGWPWADTVDRVLSKWSGSTELKPARALMAADGPGSDWACALLTR